MAAKSRKKRSTRQTKKKKQEQSFLRDEVTIWLTLAVSILIMLSNFGLGGSAGAKASHGLYYAFGAVAYVVPFLLFGIVAFLISNKGNVNAYLKTAAGLIFVVLTCALLELVDKIGGIIGEKITNVLAPVIGVAGTYVVVLIFMIICFVIMTGKSLLKGVKESGDRAYGKAKEDSARRRKIAKERREERSKERERLREQKAKEVLEQKKFQAEKPPKSVGKSKRREKHVEGVSFDTTLGGGQTPAHEDMHEVSAEPQFIIHRGDDASMPADKNEMPSVADADVQEEKPRRRKTREAAAELAKETAQVAATVASGERKSKKAYQFPPISLLKRGKNKGGESDASLRETAMKLQQTLQNFGVQVTVTNVSCGPAVTRYELQPEMGVKVSKIVGLADDIKLNLAAADIRIEAPIPGKAAVGIEVPNKENSAVMLRDLLETGEFQNSPSNISFAAGKDIGGKVVVTDIAKMPHLLIAGATGSGKSVCINTIIMSILYKARPDEVKLIMIDPKVVELSVYNGIPHLMIPVVTDPKKAAGALNWAVAEMTRRYQAFAEYNVRDMKGYNAKVEAMPEPAEGEPAKPVLMPQIVIIVDELADLMMVAPGDVEEAICRLAQLARAAGIHLVVATQRPSVNVITGLIKANMPSRIAFSVSSGVDSRTIIDMNGAEKLLGKGDMLFYPSGYQKPARVQGAFVTDKEVQDVVEYLKSHNDDSGYDENVANHVNTSEIGSGSIGSADTGETDVHFIEAGRLIIEKDKASIGMLQRTFKIGFNRAARIMDQLCEAGVVGGEEGTKPRKILMSAEEFEQYITKKS